VRRYYDEHPARIQPPGRARVRHIQVATRARAQEVTEAGHDAWEKVAERY